MYFNNRKLTAKEKQLYLQGKCICCGAKREPRKHECETCYKTRTRVHEDDWAHQQLSMTARFSLKRKVV